MQHESAGFRSRRGSGPNLQVVGHLRQESVQVCLAVPEREDQGHTVWVSPGGLLGDWRRCSRPTQLAIWASATHCITGSCSAFLTLPLLHSHTPDEVTLMCFRHFGVGALPFLGRGLRKCMGWYAAALFVIVWYCSCC